LGYHPVTWRLLPVKSKVLWETGKPIEAFVAGAKDLGWKLPQGVGFVSSDRYLSLHHQVAPKRYALECAEFRGGTRMNFERLGYAPKTTRDGTPLCISCHDREDDKPDYYEIHAIHPREEGVNCKTCHKFSGTREGWED